MKALTKTDFNFPGQKSVYNGKVRDVYNINGEKLVMVATDRISAFDVVLPEGIPYKGQMLNQIAAKFLDATTDICPNWKLATPEEYEVLEKYTLALFKRGTEIAAERGLILVDTKYEFGKHNGTIYLMDEIHTPDSSRYFYSEGYQERFEKGEPQKQLSKEFVREWLMENGFQGKEGQKVPEMTPAIVQSISDRYIELFENITGEKFVKEDTSNIAERIEKNVMNFLTE